MNHAINFMIVPSLACFLSFVLREITGLPVEAFITLSIGWQYLMFGWLYQDVMFCKGLR